MRLESLTELLDVLRRRGIEGLTVALIAVFTVLGVGLRLPRTYTARVLVDVEAPGPSPLGLMPNLVQTALGGGADAALMQTLVQRLGTRALVEQAREAFAQEYPQAARRLPPTPQLLGAIRAGVEQGSQLLAVVVTLREDQGGPRAAALFANRLVETLQEVRAQERSQERIERAQVQLDQAERLQSELEKEIGRIQEELLEFARSSGDPSVWSAELTALFQQRATLLEALREAEFRQATAEALVRHAQSRIPQLPEYRPSAYSTTAHPLRRTLEGEAAKYRAQDAQRAAEGLTEETPERRGLRAAAKALDQEAQSLPETETVFTYGSDPLRETLLLRQLEGEMSQVRAQEEIRLVHRALQEVEERLQERLRSVPELQVQLEGLRRRAETVQRVYQELLTQRTQVELALREAMAQEGRSGRRRGGVAIVDPAVPELRPVRPRVGLLTAVGVALGLFLGAGVALAVEWWHAAADRRSDARAASPRTE
ncbi:MAG: hypothetical protein KatS3mg115_1186 [Candidatus Poribacteria bacterium]|nr:MAG: hypothetical protein KatS3mg115_1186 [Candidatus Poribacteria bacterium]